jgi:hypothetical protein
MVNNGQTGDTSARAIEIAAEFKTWLMASHASMKTSYQGMIAQGQLDAQQAAQHRNTILAYEAMYEKMDLIHRTLINLTRQLRQQKRRRQKR